MAELDFNALKACTKCGIAKATSEFYTCKQKASGKRPDCKTCNDSRRVAFHKSNSEREAARKAAYRLANIDQSRRNDVAYKKANPEKIKAYAAVRRKEFAASISAYHAEYRKGNPERLKDYLANWKKENASVVNAIGAARRACKLMATPQWADAAEMLTFYETAAQLTKSTGTRHDVDHIVPIKSKLVCGLHVQANLQVITGIKNMSKGNRHWPDMP